MFLFCFCTLLIKSGAANRVKRKSLGSAVRCRPGLQQCMEHDYRPAIKIAKMPKKMPKIMGIPKKMLKAQHRQILPYEHIVQSLYIKRKI